jgi:hypothetical protein
MKIACFTVAFAAWCGAMWINLRAIRQAYAAGYGFWSLDTRARSAAWRGKNLPLFLIFLAVFIAAVLTLFALQ